MSGVRSFYRQVRPLRMHLTVDRHVYLCGYVRPAPEPQPPYGTVPLCGPCWVALHLLRQQLDLAARLSQPPDLTLAQSVELLRETEWDSFMRGLDVDVWATANEVRWAEYWRRPSVEPST